MREGTNIQIEGFDELQKKLTIVLPDMLREMAFSTDASAAAFARKEDQAGASRLTMGQEQQKPYTDAEGNAQRNGYRPAKVYSKWDDKLGWVSTSKMTKNGPLAMGHFTWAEGTKTRKGSVISHYSNKVANLWARRTKPYNGTNGKGGSPLVGKPGHLTYWKKGKSRPAMYNWSITAAIVNRMGGKAVTETEKRYAKQFKEM